MKTGMKVKLLSSLVFFLMAAPPWLHAANPSFADVKISLDQAGAGAMMDISLWRAGSNVVNQPLTIAVRSSFRVSVKTKGGEWVGISFRDRKGNVFDVPPQKCKLVGGSGVFTWTIPSDFSSGPVEITLALWKGYDKGKNVMVGELARIPWRKLGDLM